MPRRYLVVRTDRTEKDFVLRELDEGRLRQGWGSAPKQDLVLLAQKRSTREPFDDEEAAAWRNRRLLPTQPNGVQPSDIVVVPNLPTQGRWVIARVTGGYRFEISELGDYGHIVAVEPIRDNAGKIAIVEADNEVVDARLRASMRNLSRMWSIDALGPAVDRIIGAIEHGVDTTVPQPGAHKLEQMFEEVCASASTAMRKRYKAAELEQLVGALLEKIYPRGRVEHWGGPSEAGADFIVYTADALGLEYKIAVQVKCFDGRIDDVGALEQIKEARLQHKVDAGVVVTTASAPTKAFTQRRDDLEVELAIDIKVILLDEFIGLLLQHLAPSGQA